jgi:hypothetical protein
MEPCAFTLPKAVVPYYLTFSLQPFQTQVAAAARLLVILPTEGHSRFEM